MCEKFLYKYLFQLDNIFSIKICEVYNIVLQKMYNVASIFLNYH